LLALQQVFLIAEGTNRKPGQSKARRNDRKQQNQGNFFHSIRVNCCFPILALVVAQVKSKVSRNQKGLTTDAHG
jgi:hypothetical protein